MIYSNHHDKNGSIIFFYVEIIFKLFYFIDHQNKIAFAVWLIIETKSASLSALMNSPKDF